MLNALPTILTVLAFALVVARPLAPVVVTWLDRPDLQRWAWLPPAVVLALSVLSERLLAITGAPPVLSEDVSAWMSTIEALVQAGIAVAVAYQQGHQTPAAASLAAKIDEAQARARSVLDRVGPAALLVLLVAAGCRPGHVRTADDALRVACSDEAVVVVDELCRGLYERTSGEQRARVEQACDGLIDVQTAVCRGRQ